MFENIFSKQYFSEIENQCFDQNRFFLKDSDFLDSTIEKSSSRRFEWSNYQLKRTIYRSFGDENVIIIDHRSSIMIIDHHHHRSSIMIIDHHHRSSIMIIHHDHRSSIMIIDHDHRSSIIDHRSSIIDHDHRSSIIDHDHRS